MGNLNAYEAERNEILMSTNREYSKILDAQENIYKMLEYAVKLDITNIGKVSDTTKTVVESFRYKIYNNTVFREIDILPEEKVGIFNIIMNDAKIWFKNTSGLDAKGLCRAYADCDKPFVEMEKYGKRIKEADFASFEQSDNLDFSIEFNAETNQITIFNGEKFEYKDLKETLSQYGASKQAPTAQNAEKAEQVSNTNKCMKNQYISYAYENGKNKMLYGNSIDEIISKWQKIENARSEGNKLGYCYIKKNDDSSKVSRYEIATGRDVTLIYLKLPPMKKDEFAETVKQLKDDGAKFNKAKKEWYVTKDMDLSKFEKYISSKESVLGKLENNREKISENDKNNPREDITKKHEQQI